MDKSSCLCWLALLFSPSCSPSTWLRHGEESTQACHYITFAHSHTTTIATTSIEDNRHDVGGVNAGIILGLLTAGLTLWRVLADTQRLLDTSGALSSRGSLVAMQRLSNAEDGDADADATAGDLRGTRH